MVIVQFVVVEKKRMCLLMDTLNMLLRREGIRKEGRTDWNYYYYVHSLISINLGWNFYRKFISWFLEPLNYYHFKDLWIEGKGSGEERPNFMAINLRMCIYFQRIWKLRLEVMVSRKVLVVLFKSKEKATYFGLLPFLEFRQWTRGQWRPLIISVSCWERRDTSFFVEIIVVDPHWGVKLINHHFLLRIINICRLGWNLL